MHERPRTIVVLLGGADVDVDTCTRALSAARTPIVVIAADSGLEQGIRLGLEVDLVVGDLDSVSATALAEAEAAGVRVERHPAAKDESDLELAMRRAVALEPDEILVLGSMHGRVDHAFSNLALLCAEDCAGVTVRAVVDGATVRVLRGPGRFGLEAGVGDLFTLIPVGGPAEGVETSGLAYPLHGELLHPTSSRGVSNVHTEPRATVALSRGVLLAIHPRG